MGISYRCAAQCCCMAAVRVPVQVVDEGIPTAGLLALVLIAKCGITHPVRVDSAALGASTSHIAHRFLSAMGPPRRRIAN